MNSEFIEFLVRNNVLRFGQFTYKSGRVGPYFMNFGMVYGGRASHELGEFFADAIVGNFGADFDTVFGPAYKGIPLAVSAAAGLYTKRRLEKTWLFDRKEAKEHGDRSAFVGDGPRDGQRLVMVDDVITTGGTKAEALSKLSASAKASVIGLVIAVDREEKGKEKSAISEFEDASGVKVACIEKISSVFEYLHNREVGGKIHVSDENYEAFRNYQKQYGVAYG